MRVSPSVRAVQVPDENPMHPDFTPIYLVGNTNVLSIDSGEAVERYRWMLRGYLAATEGVEIATAAITHHHSDHSGNLKWIRKALDADITVTSEARPLLKGMLPKKRVETLKTETDFHVEGGPRLQVLRTPGHSVDSICFYLEEEGVLFSGDTLLGSSTTTVNNLKDYRETLQRLVALPNLKVICPGHGPLVHDPRERLQSYIDHRNMRERQIVDLLAKGKPISSWDIMRKLYPDIDKRLRRAADNNVRVHLAQLEAEGRLNVEPGKRRKKSRSTKDVEHARSREKVIKLGKRYEAEDSRALIARQENPPTDEWKVPPKYQLVGSAKD
ncbi:MAG: MBL fold metallo-hydrolase [Dehalococcoidia bacterium]|nr:MBL fold metallo-hydrolase [Dehalococcoidia bacterium]MCA9825108.1 MBL fold metallo-hydrolase [Dehalococcoidia bacterium]